MVPPATDPLSTGCKWVSDPARPVPNDRRGAPAGMPEKGGRGSSMEAQREALTKARSDPERTQDS